MVGVKGMVLFEGNKFNMTFKDLLTIFSVEDSQIYYIIQVILSEMQPNSQLVSNFDYLSEDSIVRRNKSSYLGIIATIVLVTIALSLYIPLAISFNQGIYSGATFFTRNIIGLGAKFYSGDDFKFAIVFKNRNTGVPMNHSILLQNFQATVNYNENQFWWSTSGQSQQLVACSSGYFEGMIGGQAITECLQMPDYVEYKAIFGTTFSFMSIQLKPMVGSALPFNSQSQQSMSKLLTNQQKLWTQLLRDHYYQVVFSTKVLTQDGSIKFRMNKISSTQFNIGPDTIGASFNITLNVRENLIDLSILPWNLNRNVTFLDWSGEIEQGKTLSFSQSIKSGISGRVTLQHDILTSYRTYKKLDWLIGIISGGVFLLYIMLWMPLNYFNSGLQKIQIAHKLLLQKTLEHAETQEALIQVKIPKMYLLKRLIPFCKDAKYEKIIEEVQNENDLCLLIKKMKVAVRNLKKKDFQQQIQARIVVFQEEERLIEEQSQHGQQQSNFSHHTENQNVQEAQGGKNKLMDQSKENLHNQETGFAQIKQKKHDQEQFLEQESHQEEQSNQNDRKRKDKVNENVRNSANKLVQDQEQEQQHQNHHNNQKFHNKREAASIKNEQNNINEFKMGEQILHNENSLIKILTQNRIQEQTIDPKTGLTLNQLNSIKKNPQLEPYFQNSATYMILKEQKHDNFQQIMELEQYDKWKGYFSKKKLSLRQKITSFIAFFDIFGAKYQFIGQPTSNTIFGSIMVFIILTLSVLTFLSTFIDIHKKEFVKQAIYLQPNDINFTKVTSKTFNMMTCFWVRSFFTQGKAKFVFFTQDNGVRRQFKPVQMNFDDKYLEIDRLTNLFQSYFYASDCFRLPDGITINMNKNAYFGFKITPTCNGTASYCLANRNASINLFKEAMNGNRKTIVLPAYNFDPKQQALFNSATNTSFQTIHFINLTEFNNFQQNVQVHQTQIYDNTQTKLFNDGPKLIDSNINADFSIRRTRTKSILDNQTQYVMRVSLGSTLNKITIKNKSLDYVFGIFGGILLFWYVVIQFLAKLHSRFTFYLYISKIVYEEQGYDHNFLKRFIAMTFWPRCLIPKCTKSREDLTRMRFMTRKIEDSISHLSILKYTQICYKLSSAFFSSLPAKHMSLIYFREKIDESAQVQNPLQLTKKETKQQDFLDPQQIPLIAQKPTTVTNKVVNEVLKPQYQIREQQIPNEVRAQAAQNAIKNLKEMQAQKERLVVQKLKQQNQIRLLREQENSHIIERYQPRWTDYVDVFKQNATFSFQQRDKSTSVIGGFLSILTIVLVILLAFYELNSYIKRFQMISSDTTMDLTKQGLTLVTGKNFKIAVNFLSKTNLIPVNVSTFLSDFSIIIRKQKFQRINGKIVSSLTLVPFIVCPDNYIQSWMSKTVHQSYYQGLKHSYCAPDDIALHLQGEPSDSIRQSFKFTILNHQPTILGASKLKDFLDLYHVQLHFSSPQQNSINRTINYEINSQILAYFGPSNPVKPFETNITLSKLNITYDMNTNWQSSYENTISYIYEPYSKDLLDYRYLSDPATNSWYNVSFSYTKKMQTYLVRSPKFIEVFGIIGGIIIIFFLIFGCFAISFNKYKMKYEIGAELYLFDKLRIVHQKQKIRKLGKKSENQRKQIKKMNNFSQFSILQAYVLSYFGYLLKEFNFDRNLRRMTLLQEKVSKDLNLAFFYLDLYKTRSIIDQEIENKIKLDFKLTDIYLKKIINTSPMPYSMEPLKNYARQHRLSSYEQYIVVKAIQSGVKIRQILDSRILEKLFNFIDDGVSINLNRLSDTYNSIQSSVQNKSQVQQEA